MTRACLVVSLLLATSAAAQTSGVISGRILDAQSGRPVASALVVASGPALQGTETTRTDGEGEFEIGLLPPGEYILNVQADGHQPFSQERLVVHAGRSIRVPLSMLPDNAPAAPVRFGIQVPVLPATTSQTGAIFSREQYDLIPYGRDQRSFEQAAPSAPGVVPNRPTGLQFYGSPYTGTRYRIDGVDVNDPRTNEQGRWLLQHFVEEGSVESGGFGAEYGRVAGGIVQATTRSGGNDLHGSAFFDWMPLEIPQRTLRYNLAGGAELGGPIEKDRLWFYGGFAPVLMATTTTVNTDYQYLGKLTWRVADGQTLDFAAITDDFSVRYRGHLFDRAAQVEAIAAWHRQGSDADSLQARIQVAHPAELLGRHRLAWGLEGSRDSAADASRWYGAVFLQDNWSPWTNVFLQEGLRLERDGQAKSTDLLPRFGIVWDFSGQGTARAYAFAGQFLEVAPLGETRFREHDIAGGVESQIVRDLVAGLDYVHKIFDGASDGRSSYDGATVFVAKPFSASSILRASYTLSSLRGTGSIPGDAPNAVKIDAAYAYEWSANTTLNFGTSFRAIQGSPWTTTLDARLGMVRALTTPYLLTLTVDGMNLLGREAGGQPPFAIRFGAKLSF